MHYLIIAFYTLISGFIGWIWIDYYRLIGIYDSKNLKYLVPTFLMGAAFALLAFVIEEYVMSGFIGQLNGDALNDLGYFTVRVALVEEACKAIPFIIMFIFFRSQFKEPIDYIAFFAISALGFSATENVMYFINDTNGVFVSRGILCSVGHMFYSALIAYGIVLAKYKKGVNKPLVIFTCIVGAIIAHAVYDFIAKEGGAINVIGSVAFFFLTVSAFATMINNALNNASNFSYKMMNADRVTTRILLYYLVLFLIQFAVSIAKYRSIEALYIFRFLLFNVGFIVMVVVMRMSNIKLMRARWLPVKIELPFAMVSDFYGSLPQTGFRVKGETATDAILNKYFGEYLTINPVVKSTTKPRVAIIEDRRFLDKDITFQQTRVFTDENREESKIYFLRPKTKNRVLYQDKYPIAGIYRVAEDSSFDDPNLSIKQLKFIEWIYVKPYQEEAKPGKK